MLRVSASIAQPVVTHQFEELDAISGGLIGRPTAVGIARGKGFTGSAGEFVMGGQIDYGRQSAFAMTEGFELDVRVKPDSGAQQMVLVEGKGADNQAVYRVALVRGAMGTSDYDVEVRLRVRKPGESARESDGNEVLYRTKDAPVRAASGSRWQRIEVSWHGLEASVRVNGLESSVTDAPRGRSTRRDASLDAGAADDVRELATPSDGLVSMSISSASSAFRGLMDTFQLRGVFRSSELQKVAVGRHHIWANLIDSPQPQASTTFGLRNLNASLRPCLTKSTSVPSINGRLDLSTNTLTPRFSNTMSSGWESSA